MRQEKGRRIKKALAGILSISMILTGLVIMPASTYATDDGIIATIIVNEGDNFDITANTVYYKDDGSAGTASDYNFYYDGSKLYVKDADVFQIYTKGENAERHLKFIGESTVNEFYADKTKLYIEGTANSKLNIGNVGLYSNEYGEDCYIGINNANITIDSKDNEGIITNNLEISNSNITINAIGDTGICSEYVNISNSNVKENAGDDAGIYALDCKVSNSTLDITAEYGIHGSNVSITGGNLTIDATDAAIYTEEVTEYDMSGTVTFRGGTYQLKCDTASVIAPAMVVTGGSINANAMYQDTSGTPLILTKADGTTRVYLTTISIDGVAASQKLTSLTTTDTTYATNDIYTDAAGKIYLYLPAGATVTRAAIGDAEYAGSVTATAEGSVGVFKKAILDIATATVSGIENKTYTGAALTQNISVTRGGKTLVKDTDYTISYGNNINPGTATVTITGKGNYQGTIQKTFKIIAPAVVTTLAAPKTVSAKLYGYDDIQVSWSKVSGATGYKVYYKKSTEKSYKSKTTTKTSLKLANLSDGVKYNVKVVAYKNVNGVNYEGKDKAASAIYTLKKLNTPKVSKKSAKAVTIKWTNINGETGYQISKSTSKKGTSIVAAVKTTTGKSKVISAKKGKTYYYKVRAYKTVGKTKIVGPWSQVKAYKIK